MDLISRQAAIDAFRKELCVEETESCQEYAIGFSGIERVLNDLPSAQSDTCEGCKHMGKWENEVEYGCSSPCTRCKRRVEDHYER